MLTTRTTAPLTALTAATLFIFSFGLAQPANAQDNDLDRLLEQVEKKDAPVVEAAKPAGSEAKPIDEATTTAPPKEEAKPDAKKGEVASQDEAVDDLLRQLGETEDAPETKNSRRPMPSPDQDKTKPKDQEQALDPSQKPVDERLEEILGRIKKKDQDQEKDPESGMLADAIKQMREVQKKLNEPDTGEQTQAKQKEIIKKLEVAMKKAQQAGQGRGQRQRGQRGRQPGQPQQQDNPESNPDGQGVGANLPDKPKPKSDVLVRKDIWGHLPEALRNEMNNISRETMLETRKSLIERYYLSVAKKGRSGEGD